MIGPIIGATTIFVFFLLPFLLAAIAGYRYWQLGNDWGEVVESTAIFTGMMLFMPFVGIYIVNEILKDEAGWCPSISWTDTP